MTNSETLLFNKAQKLGFRSSGTHLWEVVKWLREEKQIHVEVSSIWNELHNKVESYCYTITAPINVYYIPPVYAAGGADFEEMLHLGIAEALSLLNQYEEQKACEVTDDQVVIAYLKGYGDKELPGAKANYHSNLEKYAYALGRQGDYIEEGLTEDDILVLIRNKEPDEEILRLE